MNSTHHWSRMPGFFDLDIFQRRASLAASPLHIADDAFAAVDNGVTFSELDVLSENVVGRFELPLSCAVNFIVDQKAVVVPMATEEPSIVAACSKMAKLVAMNGGFTTTIAAPLIKGQIQFFALHDIDRALAAFALHKAEILAHAQSLCVAMHARGGGVVDVDARVVSSSIGPMLLIEPLINVVDAMGANMVNTVVEQLSMHLKKIIDGKLGIRILSNLCDQRIASASCTLQFSQTATDDCHDNGATIAERMGAAHAFAEADVYRACTHNKGILNGVDAVALATGNDFRAIEAGAHAYASMSGAYKPLTQFVVDSQRRVITARLSLPLAVGVVGGLMRVHPGVKLAHAILGDHARTSSALSSVMVSVGLSQCLAAVLALSQDGIQKGHMKLHKKKVACAAPDIRP